MLDSTNLHSHTTNMEKGQISNWADIEETIGENGSESGKIIYDVEHDKGARITIEKETDIAPFAVTLGISGVMFHTDFFSTEIEARNFVFESMRKIENLFKHLEMPANQQDENWKEIYNRLVEKIAE
jgi:hypothetical protein